MISGTLLLDHFTKQTQLFYQPWTAYFQNNKGQGIGFYFVSATIFWDC